MIDAFLKELHYGIWPMSTSAKLIVLPNWDPRDAPRCPSCGKVHWVGCTVYRHGVPTCYAIIEKEFRKMNDFAERLRETTGIAGLVQPFVNDGVRCPVMPAIPLEKAYNVMPDGMRRDLSERKFYVT